MDVSQVRALYAALTAEHQAQVKAIVSAVESEQVRARCVRELGH